MKSRRATHLVETFHPAVPSCRQGALIGAQRVLASASTRTINRYRRGRTGQLVSEFRSSISSFPILLLLVMAHMQEKARGEFLVARQFAANDACFQRHVRKVRDAFARFLDASSGGFRVHSFPSPLCGAGTHTHACTHAPAPRVSSSSVVMLTGASGSTWMSSRSNW